MIRIHDEIEADTRAERIGPVLAAAGWGRNGSKVRREDIFWKRFREEKAWELQNASSAI